LSSVGHLVGVSDGPLLGSGSRQLVEGNLDSVGSGVSSLWLSNSVVHPKEDSVESGVGTGGTSVTGLSHGNHLSTASLLDRSDASLSVNEVLEALVLWVPEELLLIGVLGSVSDLGISLRWEKEGSVVGDGKGHVSVSS